MPTPRSVDFPVTGAYTPRLSGATPAYGARPCVFRLRRLVMKVRSSLKSLKSRHRDCKVVRRKGRVYVINKTDPRFKAKQG